LRPKAFRVLSAAGVRIFTASASTVGEALGLFRDGKLVESLSADVEGHWM
jgi:predicted Fe-Mo cluster-binding NifX family protein